MKKARPFLVLAAVLPVVSCHYAVQEFRLEETNGSGISASVVLVCDYSEIFVTIGTKPMQRSEYAMHLHKGSCKNLGANLGPVSCTLIERNWPVAIDIHRIEPGVGAQADSAACGDVPLLTRSFTPSSEGPELLAEQ